MTNAALLLLDEELRPLAASPNWDTIQKLIPPDGIRTGKQSLQLYNASMEPGVYDVGMWVNTGEPGMVYLKAFEVTKNTPLSVDTLKNDTNEWVGWSDNPKQLFLSNSTFAVDNDSGGKLFAARLEAWFVPDSTKPERMLMEKVFKVQGLQD